jgi:hypothetical protein
MSHPDVGTVRGLATVVTANRLARELSLCDLYSIINSAAGLASLLIFEAPQGQNKLSGQCVFINSRNLP